MVQFRDIPISSLMVGRREMFVPSITGSSRMKRLIYFSSKISYILKINLSLLISHLKNLGPTIQTHYHLAYCTVLLKLKNLFSTTKLQSVRLGAYIRSDWHNSPSSANRVNYCLEWLLFSEPLLVTFNF